MKFGSYILLLATSGVCLVLIVGLISISHLNQKLQLDLQTRQQYLNNGIFSAQGQQLSSGILQDMASAASNNAAIYRLLEKNGYKISTQKPSSPEADSKLINKILAEEIK
jgi:hypothetical protein